MKVAFIGQKGIPAINGGVERYVENLAISLKASGQDVLVYNRYDYLPDRLREYRGVKIINRFYIKGKNTAAITQTWCSLWNVIFKQRVDILHFQGIGPALLCWLPKLIRPKLKIVSTLHSFDYYNDKWSPFAKFMLRLGERLMCHYSDAVIVLTENMQTYVQEKYGRKTFLIPNGANPYEKSAKDQLLPFGLEPNEYIISVSRIIRLKGIQYLIAAFKNTKTDKKLVIVGEGEYKLKLEELAEDDERIVFVGNQGGRTLNQLFANAYLFVQPSEMEGLSSSLLEAMAHRTACLASDIPANKDALGSTGFHFRSKDITDLHVKLKYLLDNPEKVAEKANEAYIRIEDKFSWPEVAQKITKVYQEVIDNK